MTDQQYAMWIAIALLGIVGSSICSGMETGLYALNRAALALRARQDRNRVARMLDREARATDRSLATLLIANNVFNYLGALGVTAILEAQDLLPLALIALNAVIITPVLLIFAESLPKEVFRRHAIGLSLMVTPLLVAFRWIFTLVGALPLVLAIARAAGRATGLPLEPEMGVRQRIAEMLKQDDRLLSGEQAELIDRALEFRRATVGEEMAPWASVVTLEASWNRERALTVIGEHPHRRYPVIDASGVVSGSIDSMRLILSDATVVGELVEPVPRIQGRCSVREALELLRDAKARMLVVEFKGKPLGLATAKDLVEPLTGELLAW